MRRQIVLFIIMCFMSHITSQIISCRLYQSPDPCYKSHVAGAARLSLNNETSKARTTVGSLPYLHSPVKLGQRPDGIDGNAIAPYSSS